MNVVADTSFVVAILGKDDRKRQSCIKVYNNHQGIIWIPQTALTEICYMLERDSGRREVINFLRRLPETKYRVLELQPEDILRTAEILEKYHDTRLDFVDATIAAVAERLNITHLLTLDYRDFGFVRPRHIERFELLPPLE